MMETTKEILLCRTRCSGGQLIMSSMMSETAAMMPETADGTVPTPGTGSPSRSRML